MGGRPGGRRDGGAQDRHPLPFRGLERGLPPAGRGLYVQRIREGTHPQSRRALQPGDQVRRLLGSRQGAGGGLCGHGALLPQGQLHRCGRPDRVPHPGGQRPEQGPELLPLPAVTGAARHGPLPDRGHHQARSAAHRPRSRTPQRGKERQPGHLFRGEGFPAVSTKAAPQRKRWRKWPNPSATVARTAR